MKKIMFSVLFLLIPFNVRAITAESAIVMDYNSGRILYEKNAYEKKLIASTTKIMTAIIAIENGDLTENVVVSSKILKAYGSSIYIEVGERLTLKDLIYGLMLRSGNELA